MASALVEEVKKQAKCSADGPGAYMPPSAVSVEFHSQRRHATWVGGSMLASLSTFPSLAITREMYAEGRTNKQALIEQQVTAQ